MITPDEQTVEPHIEQAFVAPVPENPELSSTMKIVVQLVGLTFPGPGVYYMHLMVQDHERNIERNMRARLRVMGPPVTPA